MISKLMTVCACATALALATPALADAPQGFAGTASGGYGHLSSSGGGSANEWDINGQAAFGLGMSNIGAELDGGYHNLSGSGASDDIWNIGGNVFWAPAQGRLGLTVQYESLTGTGAGVHFTDYGGFGEYYASDFITVGLNGGGFSGSGSGSSSNGSYFGGGASGYLMPDLALTGLVNYFSESGGHITNYTAQGEWLVTESLPISVFGGYTYTDLAGRHLDEWFVGLKIYTDGNGSSLVQKHRNGALDSIVRPGLLIGG